MKMGFKDKKKVLHDEMDNDVQLSISKSVVETHQFMQVDECPLILLVSPLLSFLRFVFITHSKFEFSSEKRLFCHQCGSWLRKVICVIIQIILIINLWGYGQLTIGLLKEKKIVGLFKVMNLAYISLSLAYHYEIMFKGDQLNEILNQVQAMQPRGTKCRLHFENKLFMKCVSVGLVLLYVVQAFIFSIMSTDGLQGMSIKDGIMEFLSNCADQGARKLWVMTCSRNITTSQLLDYKLSNDWKGNLVIPLLGLVHFGIHVIGSTGTVMAFLTVTLWALVFWKIFHDFYQRIADQAVPITLKDIRQFNTITGMVDKFNRVFGWTILTVVVVGILHFSVYIVDLFQSSQVWTQRFVIGLSLFTFSGFLLASAQVHHSAANFGRIMKLGYQNECTWHNFHDDIHTNCSETTQGMLVIFHEIQINRMGFTGLGFFTITYSLIGTVVSLISTYSIVVMQFQNLDPIS